MPKTEFRADHVPTILQGSELFKGAELATIDAELKDSRVQTIEPGQVLLDPRHINAKIYIVLHGELLVCLELQRQYRSKAETDSLTGLHNRAWFEEVFPKQLELCERTGKHVSLLMVDIDHSRRSTTNIATPVAMKPCATWVTY